MRARKRKRGPDISRMCPRLARGFAIVKKRIAPQLSGNSFGVDLLCSLFHLSRVRPAGLRAAPSCRGRKPTPVFALKNIPLNPWHSGAPGGMHDTSDGRQGLMSPIRGCTPLRRCNESIHEPLQRADARPHVRRRTYRRSQKHTDSLYRQHTKDNSKIKQNKIYIIS